MILALFVWGACGQLHEGHENLISEEAIYMNSIVHAHKPSLHESLRNLVWGKQAIMPDLAEMERRDRLDAEEKLKEDSSLRHRYRSVDHAAVSLHEKVAKKKELVKERAKQAHDSAQYKSYVANKALGEKLQKAPQELNWLTYAGAVTAAHGTGEAIKKSYKFGSQTVPTAWKEYGKPILKMEKNSLEDEISETYATSVKPRFAQLAEKVKQEEVSYGVRDSQREKVSMAESGKDLLAAKEDGENQYDLEIGHSLKNGGANLVEYAKHNWNDFMTHQKDLYHMATGQNVVPANAPAEKIHQLKHNQKKVSAAEMRAPHAADQFPDSSDARTVVEPNSESLLNEALNLKSPF